MQASNPDTTSGVVSSVDASDLLPNLLLVNPANAPLKGFD